MGVGVGNGVGDVKILGDEDKEGEGVAVGVEYGD